MHGSHALSVPALHYTALFEGTIPAEMHYIIPLTPLFF